MKTTTNIIRYFFLSIFAMLVFSTIGFAQITPYSAAGANPAAIQATVNQFRADLGALNPNNGQSFTTGRREINWDGVPDNFSAPNNLPPDFFNVNSPRGAVFSNIGGGDLFQVSAISQGVTPVRFGNIDASYTTTFQTFSAQKLFTGVAPATPNAGNLHRVTEVNFYIPGTKIPATVNAFGAVFSDVDSTSSTTIAFFRVDGSRIETRSVQTFNNGLSFLGVRFDNERVARVVINNGTSNVLAGNADGGAANDVVVMDDFIYGEPRAAQYHTGDFDGDGVTDSTVYRPSTANWFILNSGSNTVTIDQFGLNGDIPVDGDFDGDRRADLAIFRPSNGEWYFKRSSNGTVFGAQFGQNGDKPVVGDYDKDGKSDIAIWRPANGNYFVLRSSSDFSTFFGYAFGINGDIPVQGGAQ